MRARLSRFFLPVLLLLGAGCANITTPTGGRKDIRPPKLVSISPADSLRNTRVKRIEMYFDEYITVSDPGREVQLSPILPIAPTVTGLNKHVVVKIIDSLLEDNTTYRLSFGSAIRDVHEGNAFSKFTYTFTTGDYFDSLQMHGTITNAQTGLSDLENVTVMLYYASDNDSAVVRHKPKYVAKAESNGLFSFKGLPRRPFRIYALKDANENLVYDGPSSGELIAFADNMVIPGDTTQAAINLRVFAEIADTAAKVDSSSFRERPAGRFRQSGDVVPYTAVLDTASREKRSFDISGPIRINFPKRPVLNRDKITLTMDSAGTDIPCRISIVQDTHKVLISNPVWHQNTLYTLRLAKGFARDSAGKDLPPARYVFRTKEEETDYGRITVNLPGRYRGGGYLFRVMADGDSIYQRPVTDTVVVLRLLKPAKYTFRVIVDKNRDGQWNTGDLLKHMQPETVIAYPEPVGLRAGFEHVIDFEQKPATGGRGRRDQPR